MSVPNCYRQKCILCCCPYDFNWNVGKFSTQLTPAAASSCLKHIPPDIHQNVVWNQLDANNCLKLCSTCDGNLRDLAKLNCELEEIQRKITELADCISLHVRNERGKHEPNLPPTHKEPDSLHRKVAERNLEIQYSALDHSTLGNQNSSSSSNDNADVDVNHMEFTNLDDNNDGFELDEEASQSKFPLTADTQEDSASKIQGKELKEPKKQKSNSQQKKGPNNAGFDCSTCQRRFSRYTILKNHNCEEQTVECETCGLSFSSSGVLKLHTRSHTGEKPYKCELCDKGFSIKANLRTHVVQVHTKEKLFECKICGKKFSNQSYLIRHKITHTDEAKFDCEVCGQHFKSFKNLKFHMVTHSTGTSHPFECDLCDKTFANPYSLNTHKNRVHLGLKFAECEICGKSLPHKSSFIQHMRVHSEESPFQCSYCEKKFRSAEALKYHKKNHTDVGEFPCDICGKACHNSNSLKWHRRRYHQENKIQCEICGKQIFKDNMKDHLRSHSDEGIKCDVCGKPFASTAYLRQHRTTHSVRVREKPYQCSICGKTFRVKNKLTGHEWIHKDLGEFTCNICHKTFKNPRLLKIHVVGVHQKTKISCKICGKLVDKHRFSTHQKTHTKPTHQKTRTKPTHSKCDICVKKFSSKQRLIYHITHFCHICNKYFPHKSNVSSLAGHQIEVHSVNSIFYPSDDERTNTGKRKRVPSKEKQTMTSKALKNILFKRQLKVQITKLDVNTAINLDNDKNDSQEVKRKIVATRSCKRKSSAVNYNENSSEDEIKSENYSDEDVSNHLQVKVEVKSENEFSDIDDY